MSEENQSLAAVDELVDMDTVRRMIGGSRPITRVTVYQLIKRGELPSPIKITPAMSRWRRSEIKAFIAAKAAERNGGNT